MLGFMCLQTWTQDSPAALVLTTSTQKAWGSTEEEISFIRIVKMQATASGEKARVGFFPLHSVLIVQQRTDTGKCENLNVVLGVPHLVLFHRLIYYCCYTVIFSKICFCFCSFIKGSFVKWQQLSVPQLPLRVAKLPLVLLTDNFISNDKKVYCRIEKRLEGGFHPDLSGAY